MQSPCSDSNSKYISTKILLTAKSGQPSQKRLFANFICIDFITDMVMPGMSGHELWQILAEIRPGTKVLCMSGYIGNAVLSHSMLEVGQVFLQKPFTRDSLNRKVREALDH